MRYNKGGSVQQLILNVRIEGGSVHNAGFSLHRLLFPLISDLQGV